MFNVRQGALRPLATGLLVSSLAGTAFGAVSPDFVTITATNSNGSASLMIPTGAVPFDGPTTQTWISPGSISLDDGPNHVATIGGGSRVTVDNGGAGFSIAPALFFEADAGLDTVFTVTTATVSFTVQTLVGGSAAMTLTDSGGGGAFLTGGNDGGNSVVGRYDDSVFGPSSLFAAVPALATASSIDGGFPGGAVGANAISISMDYVFTLSGGDSASTSGVIGAIPEPGSALLLMFGGLLAARRR